MNDEEKQFINKTNILGWLNSDINRYNNIRLLKTRLENAVYDELTENLYFETWIDVTIKDRNWKSHIFN